MKNITEILKRLALLRLQLADDDIETTPLNDVICQIRWGLLHNVAGGQSAVCVEMETIDPALHGGVIDHILELEQNGLNIQKLGNRWKIWGWTPTFPKETSET
jgi:hypothetical protein